MDLLFDDRLAPITSTIGLIEASLADCVRAFLDWQRSIYDPMGISLEVRPVDGPLDQALLSLLPLTNIVRRRHLFVPTASGWTAFFDNGHQGTDAFSVASYLAKRMGRRGMRVAATPDTIEGEHKGARGRYGGIVWEVYGPEKARFLNYVRSVSAVNDGGRWGFDQGGTPFPFEDLERYRARRVKDRFTFDMLRSNLAKMGLRPFDEEFYLPASDPVARLIDKSGPAPEDMREYSLDEARARY